MTEIVIGIRVRAWDSQSIRVLAGFRQTVRVRNLPWRWQVSTKRKKRSALNDVPARAWILGPGVRPPHDARPDIPLISCEEFDIRETEACEMAALLDQSAVGSQAAEHLRTCGYPAYAVLIPQEVGPLRLRALACAMSLEAEQQPVHRLEFHRGTVSGMNSLRTFLSQLSRQPHGIFAPDDAWAARLRQLAWNAGIPVPERIGILGAGDLSSACLASTPELSSVAVPWHAFGSAAVGQIQHLLAGETTKHPRVLRPFTVEARSSTLFRGYDDPFVQRACALMRKQLQKPWSIQELAQRLRVSEATLNRRLRLATGMSPHKWRNQRRLELAQQLLADPLLSLAQVQRRCGFGSMRSFHRLLQEGCGMGPEAYRQHLLLGGSAAAL